MKNFTNNFKQFTSHLSARWLIMAFMLLLGVSSTWGANNATKSDGSYRFYFQFSGGDTWWNNSGCNHYAWVWANGAGGQIQRIYKLETTSNASTGNQSDVFYMNIPNNMVLHGMILFRGNPSKTNPTNGSTNFPAEDTYYNKTNDIILTNDISSKNYITAVSNGSSTVTYSTYKTVSVVSKTLSASNAKSGSGTQADPYVYDENSTMKLSASATIDDHNFSIQLAYGSSTATITSGESKSIDVALTTAASATAYTVTYTPLLGGSTSNKGTASTETIYYKTEKSCTPATSITSAELQDGTISLVGNFTTCGAKYHGFQWRKSTSEWCNDGDESQDFSNYVKLGETEGGDGEEGFFTPESGVTYVFRTYIYNNGSWIYSSESSPVEVPCPTIAIPNIITSDEVCPNKEISLSDYNNGVDGVLWYSDQDYLNPVVTVNINSETAFYARIKDGNCYSDAATLTLTLTNFTAPEKPQLEEYSKGICANETAEITISDYNDSYTYQLYKNSTIVETPEFNTGVFTVSEAGSYTIKAVEQECNIESTPSDPFNLTVNGTTITQSPEVVHPYEVVTFTAGEQAKWALYTNPSSGSQLSDDDAKYSGKDTAYITKGESTTTKFKGEAANGYVIHATVGDCTASYTFNVVEDPDNCK